MPEPIDLSAVNDEWWKQVARELVRPGFASTLDITPSDLPARIRHLATAQMQAAHQARTLAGEVASLTNRLDDELPRIFDTVLDELADDLAARQVEIQAADVHEVGIAAFRLALRLVTDHELRERDVPRPLTLADADAADGGADGASRVIRSDGLTADGTSPTSVPSHAGLAGIPDVVDYDRDGNAVALWGIPLEPDSPHHPAVAYVDDTLHALDVRFGGCDDSMLCRRKIITRALRESLSGVEMGLTGHMQAVERIALSLYGQALVNPDITTGHIADATRAALTFSTIFPTSEARDRAREQARAD